MNIKPLVNTIGKSLSKNSPTILTGLSVAGVITTTVLAVKVTPKAKDILDDYQEKRVEKEVNRLCDEHKEKGTSNISLDDIIDEAETNVGKIPKIDVIKLTWKCYLPVAISAAATIACIIGSHSISSSRNAALVGLYSLSEKALKEYKDELLKLEDGKEKLQEVQEKIAQKQVDGKSKARHGKKKNSEDSKDEVPKTVEEKDILVTGCGDDLCMDSITGRLFTASREYIRECINDLKEESLRNGGTPISVNDVFYKYGLRSMRMWDFLGWNEDNPLEVAFASTLTDKGRPCLVINYVNFPEYDFERVN